MYFQRHFSLEEIDQQWIEHLKTMDALREGIGLQGYGQKDPKKEYKKAGFDLFTEMMDRIQANSDHQAVPGPDPARGGAGPRARRRSSARWPSAASPDKSEDEAAEGGDGAQRATRRPAARGGPRRWPREGEPQAKGETVRRERPKVGRNDPCPCGSGKKYKKCHGKDEEAAAEGVRPGARRLTSA